MNRLQEEKHYWDEAAKDPQVDDKYICNLDTSACLKAIGDLKGNVLEIGCGVGRLMKDGYYGIDISPKMLAIAKKRKPKCNFQLTDGRFVPYKDNYFDAVYCMLVFQHIPIDAVTSYIDETQRVLKKGGKFIFQYIEGNEDGPFSKHHSAWEIAVLLGNRGLLIDHIEKGLIHPQWTWVYATKL